MHGDFEKLAGMVSLYLLCYYIIFVLMLTLKKVLLRVITLRPMFHS